MVRMIINELVADHLITMPLITQTGHSAESGQRALDRAEPQPPTNNQTDQAEQATILAVK